MNPQAQAPKKIVSVEFGPSPKAATVYEKNLIAVFEDGTIQVIGNYQRVSQNVATATNEIARLTTGKATWELAKSLCDAMPEFQSGNVGEVPEAAVVPENPSQMNAPIPTLAQATTDPASA